MERDIFSILYLCSLVEVLPSTLPFRLTRGATAFELSALALACRRNYSTHPEPPLSFPHLTSWLPSASFRTCIVLVIAAQAVQGLSL